jgi:Protein of unknown function (DUF3551)
MRSILSAAVLISVACMLPGTNAAAQNEPWCSLDREDGGESCRFSTFEQCRANAIDGWCIRNSRGVAAQMVVPAPAAAPAAPAAPAATAAPIDAPAPVETRRARKKPDTRQSSTTARPATNIVPSRAVANVSIPLPDRALLAPPPDFNCEFTGAVSVDASAPRQATLTSAPTSPDAARMKADYERQCYRHVEIISRDRLRRLQASVGTTIKAVHSSEQPGSKTPLPAPALLAAPPEFNCEFKTSADDARTAPAPGPGADAALQTKLDYELQCYRHAAIIWRDRMQQLQASVGETIKAVNRNKQPAVEQRRGSRN